MNTDKNTDIILLRGLPGSGKTTYAHRFWDKKYIVSADDFFINAEGVYVFNKEKIGEAHEKCWRQFYQLLNLDAPPPYIVVDNTNISAQEMTPYTMAARAVLRDKVRIFTLNLICSPETALNRQTHGVPIFNLGVMYQRMMTADRVFGVESVGLQLGPGGDYPSPDQLALGLALAR